MRFDDDNPRNDEQIPGERKFIRQRQWKVASKSEGPRLMDWLLLFSEQHRTVGRGSMRSVVVGSFNVDAHRRRLA